VLHDLGLRLVSWTRRGFDTRMPDVDLVFARLAEGLAAGDILLLHDGHCARTASGDPVVLQVFAAAHRARAVARPLAGHARARDRPVSGATFRALARRAAARYPRATVMRATSRTASSTRDPVFEHLLSGSLLPRDASILDLGCGQGLLAALLAAEGAHGRLRYRGIDFNTRDIERARARGPLRLRIRRRRHPHRPIRHGPTWRCCSTCCSTSSRESQDDILRRVREALAGGGTLLMRVADATAGLRYRITEALDRAATRLRGQRVGRLHHLPLAERARQLEALGFSVEARPMSEGHAVRERAAGRAV
jgi:SAM-dependent methyltransferase